MGADGQAPRAAITIGGKYFLINTILRRVDWASERTGSTGFAGSVVDSNSVKAEPLRKPGYESKRANPSADKTPQKHAHDRQRTDRDEGKYMNRREVGQDADGAGKRRQRARVAVKNGRAHEVHAKVEGVQP